jgi:hypothetical protein
LPGLRFFYQGQFEGRTERLPVHLGRWSDEPPNDDLQRFYARLTAAVKDDVFHAGEWTLLDVHSAGDWSNGDLRAWSWLLNGQIRVVALNLGEGTAQGLVQISSALPGDPRDDAIVFEDQLDGQRYPWSRRALDQRGLYVKLDKGASHILSIL